MSSKKLIEAALRLKKAVADLKFGPPVSHVYNPLDYAWTAHECYLRKYGRCPKRIVFLGMNPGPFGMVQTGVPFGEIAAVRDWLGVIGVIGRPQLEHPRRPIQGFECARSEVSGQRLWNLFAQRFGKAEEFFREHMVLNYCPLAFVEETGRNRTPDKLASSEKALLLKACDQHLKEAVEALRPEWVIGIGDFAYRRAENVFSGGQPKLGQVLHPSPANPHANRAWAATVTRQLEELGVWFPKVG